MPDYVCMIQKGQPPHEKRVELESGLRRIAKHAFGDDPDAISFRWTVFDEGFAFTAGEPSTSSIVIRSVPVGFPDDERESFLRSVCDLWQEVAGCTKDEIVATAWDGPLPL